MLSLLLSWRSRRVDHSGDQQTTIDHIIENSLLNNFFFSFSFFSFPFACAFSVPPFKRYTLFGSSDSWELNSSGLLPSPQDDDDARQQYTSAKRELELFSFLYTSLFSLLTTSFHVVDDVRLLFVLSRHVVVAGDRV